MGAVGVRIAFANAGLPDALTVDAAIRGRTGVAVFASRAVGGLGRHAGTVAGVTGVIRARVAVIAHQSGAGASACPVAVVLKRAWASIVARSEVEARLAGVVETIIVGTEIVIGTLVVRDAASLRE